MCMPANTAVRPQAVQRHNTSLDKQHQLEDSLLSTTCCPKLTLATTPTLRLQQSYLPRVSTQKGIRRRHTCQSSPPTLRGRLESIQRTKVRSTHAPLSHLSLALVQRRTEYQLPGRAWSAHACMRAQDTSQLAKQHKPAAHPTKNRRNAGPPCSIHIPSADDPNKPHKQGRRTRGRWREMHHTGMQN